MRQRHLTRDQVMQLARENAYRTDQGCLIPTLWRPQPNGYVRVMIDGKLISLHRLVMGEPSGLTVDHECHNRDPECVGVCLHRRCIEESHLVVRESGENWARGHGPDHGFMKTHCPRGHPYSGDNLRLRPNGTRVCRTCHRERERLRRQ